MRVRIVAGNGCRKTAVKLKESFINKGYENTLLINSDIYESAYRHRDGDLLINFGCSTDHIITQSTDMNSWKMVKVASNKLYFFKLMDKLGMSDYIPEWTNPNESDKILEWVSNKESLVYRTNVTSSKGRNTRVLDYGQLHNNACPAELYRSEDFDSYKGVVLVTKFFKGDREYRVHVLNSGKKVEFIPTVKTLNKGVDTDNFSNVVRTIDTGWTYSYDLYEKDEENLGKVYQLLADVMDKTKTSFLAFDILFNNEGEFKILEANSAPGLDDNKVNIYTEYFLKRVGK